MPIRRLLVLALMAGMPKIASAQFTTFIPPRNVVQDSIKAAAVVQQQVQSDSIAHAQIANMKTWVDSAAGLAPVPTAAADSLVENTAVATTMASATTASATADTTTFRNGMRAPATASSLPLLVLIGSLLIVGGLLVMRRPEPPGARVQARRRA